MKKKILFFIGGSYVSGLEIITLLLIKGLQEKGDYDVRCIISGWNDGHYKASLEKLGIKVYPIKIGWFYIRKPLWTIDSLVHYPKAFFSVRKILKEFKPDICHFCNYGMPFLLYPLIKHKSIYSLHETYLPNAKHRVIFNTLNKKITYFTAVSKHIVRVLEGLNIAPEKIKLVYNGIPAFSNQTSENSSATDTVLKFAIIGQVVPWKGHGNLVSAVEKLIGKGINNFVVQIYGNDTTEYATEIRKVIKEKELDAYFIWKGFVKDQASIYADNQVVIVPSLSAEPCSLSIIESMTMGKGLIVSDRGGNPELVQNNEDGLVFTADDFVQLSNCMETFINDRDKINFFSNNARERAKQKFTYQSMVNTYVDIYKLLD